MNISQPFDSLASDYDAAFTQTAIGRYLRGRVHARLDQHFQPGDSVLELGCGTGEDALHLAERGVQVLATDSSKAMLDITRAKVQGSPLVTVTRLDLSELTDSSRAQHAAPLQKTSFDGAFASFGPVNALEDGRPLAAWLAEYIRPGGVVALGVMGPLCLWEMGWHGLHGDFRTAFRRLKGHSTFQANDSANSMTVYYPSIIRLKRDFAPEFRCIYVEALGLCLPPSDAFGVVEQRPRLMRRLMMLEDRLAPLAPLARFADHYWIEFERI